MLSPPPYDLYVPIEVDEADEHAQLGGDSGVYYVPIIEETEDEKTAMIEAEMEQEMLESMDEEEWWDRYANNSDDDSEGSDYSDSTVCAEDGHRAVSRSPSPSPDCPAICIRPPTPSSFASSDSPLAPPVSDGTLLSPTWNRSFRSSRPISTRRPAPKPPVRRSQPPSYSAFCNEHVPAPIKLRIPFPASLRPPSSRPRTPSPSPSPPPALERTWSSAILPGMECWSPRYGGGGGWPEWKEQGGKTINLPTLKAPPAPPGLTLPSMKLESPMEE